MDECGVRDECTLQGLCEGSGQLERGIDVVKCTGAAS
jgi:hypothetical protein